MKWGLYRAVAEQHVAGGQERGPAAARHMDRTRASTTGVTWEIAAAAVGEGDGTQIVAGCGQKPKGATHPINTKPLETGWDWHRRP